MVDIRFQLRTNILEHQLSVVVNLPYYYIEVCSTSYLFFNKIGVTCHNSIVAKATIKLRRAVSPHYECRIERKKYEI